MFDDIWYDHMAGRPAYEHLSASELREAIETAEQLLEEGEPLVDKLNQQSLEYRNGES
ncbi:Primosomal replication protein N'' [Halorubrum sp. DM2]|nr:Primosomal replication protein N'' [Halorubrum sp. DM2]